MAGYDISVSRKLLRGEKRGLAGEEKKSGETDAPASPPYSTRHGFWPTAHRF